MTHPAPTDGLGPHCPRWCPNVHHLGWTYHARNCGEVTIRAITYSVDAVKYADGEPEMVSFCIYGPNGAQVGNYLPEQARRIYDILGAALGLVDHDQSVMPVPGRQPQLQ